MSGLCPPIRFVDNTRSAGQTLNGPISNGCPGVPSVKPASHIGSFGSFPELWQSAQPPTAVTR